MLRFYRRINLGGGTGLNVSGSGLSLSTRYRWGSLGTRGFSIRSGIPGLTFQHRFRKGKSDPALTLISAILSIPVFLTIGIVVLAIKLLILGVLALVETVLWCASLLLTAIVSTVTAVARGIWFVISKLCVAVARGIWFVISKLCVGIFVSLSSLGMASRNGWITAFYIQPNASEVEIQAVRVRRTVAWALVGGALLTGAVIAIAYFLKASLNRPIG